MQRGRIELIMGTMFAGKSTELLRRLNKQTIASKRVMYVKFIADIRYTQDLRKTEIVTHSGLRHDSIAVTLLSELGTTWGDYDVIGIDEG